MKPNQDWEAVWPATRTFHPASVPLPVRQGATQTKTMVRIVILILYSYE